MHYLTWRHAEPSLVLVAVVWYALRSDPRRAGVFGLIAGVCEDLLGGSMTGAHTGGAWTIATTATALFVSALSQRFFADSIPVVAAVVAIATLVSRLFYWTVMSLEGYPAGYARAHFHEALWEALLNAILIAVLMLGTRVLERRTVR